MPVQKTRAIVIRAYPLREYDKIISFYTVDFGKVRAVARGVRRPKSRSGGSLQLLNYGDLLFFERPNKDLQIVNSFDLISGFDDVKADFDRLSYACYLVELVDAIERENSANQEIFHLLRSAFDVLTNIDDVALLVRAFELKLLDRAGFAPQLACCVVCASLSLTVTQHFSSRLGGLICRNCAPQDINAISMVRGSCELMKRLRQSDFTQLSRLRASKANHRELKYVLSNFISYHTERTLKSLKFIDDNLK